jgi:hypothetical protein
MLALLKLQNGTEVIGTVKVNRDAVTIEEPLQLNYRLVATQPMPTVSVSRYMPFSQEVVFTFNREDVVHITKPRDAMAQYYVSALKNYKKYIDQSIEEELLHAASSHEENAADEGDITDAYRALLERVNLKGPLN